MICLKTILIDADLYQRVEKCGAERVLDKDGVHHRWLSLPPHLQNPVQRTQFQAALPQVHAAPTAHPGVAASQ